MLKVNLTEPRTDWRKQLAVALVSVSVLGLVALLLPIFSSHWAEPRPLQVEEQEAVVAATVRLEKRVPKLSDWLKDFRLSLDQNELDLQVRSAWRKSDLVEQSESTLVFTNQFFSADSVTQEQALLTVLVAMHSQIESESEVAFDSE